MTFAPLNNHEFDAFVDAWVEVHPGEDVPLTALFGQWLANRSGSTIIGRQVNGDGLVVALPENETEENDELPDAP